MSMTSASVATLMAVAPPCVVWGRMWEARQANDGFGKATMHRPQAGIQNRCSSMQEAGVIGGCLCMQCFSPRNAAQSRAHVSCEQGTP